MRIGDGVGCGRPLILGTEGEEGTVPSGTANEAQVPLSHRGQGSLPPTTHRTQQHDSHSKA